MGLESGTYIDDLVTTNPVGASDQKNEGDDHFRLVKATLKNTFPNMVGRLSRVQEKTSEYTVVVGDNTTVIEATGDGDWDLILTAAATLGNGHYIFLINSSTGAITIDPDGAELVAGAATLVIAAGETCALYCTGTEFLASLGLISLSDLAHISLLNAFTNHNTFAKGLGAEYKNNLRIASSVGSKILTVEVQGNDGNEPSATNPVEVTFRDGTITLGNFDLVQITAALSMTVPSGGTLGFAANEKNYIHVYLINNAGTAELAISKHNRWEPGELITTVAATATSDDADTMYSTTLRATVPFVYIGRILITTGAVAGEWDNPPAAIAPHGVIPRQDLRQEAFTASGSFTVPPGVLWIDAELHGPGGGGGGASDGSAADGAPGSGGAYCRGLIAVFPGQVVTISLGTPGTAGSTAGGNGGDGGSTIVEGLTAEGGNGGTGNSDNAGASAAASGGDTNVDSPGTNQVGAGVAPQGGGSGTNQVANTNGGVGATPGGGGGGAGENTSGGKVGGVGAAGLVIIRW